MPDDPQILIKRSAKRRKTISAAFVDGGATILILAPARATDAELQPAIDKLRARLLRQKAKRETADDAALTRRAAELNREYFQGELRLARITYVANQQRRYGSCTPATGVIRISHRVASMPAWVRDYVLVHELAHLREANHGPRFWKLVSRYPRSERARGYLMAIGLEQEADDADDSDLQ